MRAARPRRVVDLVAVLTEGPSTTSTATRTQNIVELYGVLPTVANDVELNLFLLSDSSQPQARDWPAHWHVCVQLIETLVNGVSEGQLIPIWQGVAQTTSWLRSLTTCSQQNGGLVGGKLHLLWFV